MVGESGAEASATQGHRVLEMSGNAEVEYPASIKLPDGEEQPYGITTCWQLHDAEHDSEVRRQCIRPPPNRTVHDIESPPRYRSNSMLLLSSQQNISPQLGKNGDKAPLVTVQHNRDTKDKASASITRGDPLTFLEAPPSYVSVVAASTSSESTRHPSPDV